MYAYKVQAKVCTASNVQNYSAQSRGCCRQTYYGVQEELSKVIDVFTQQACQ